MDLYNFFLVKMKVFGIWRSNSQKTCSGFGICSSSIHTKRRILCKLLHGWFSYTDLNNTNFGDEFMIGT
jgi:hypothetical protein